MEPERDTRIGKRVPISHGEAASRTRTSKLRMGLSRWLRKPMIVMLRSSWRTALSRTIVAYPLCCLGTSDTSGSSALVTEVRCLFAKPPQSSVFQFLSAALGLAHRRDSMSVVKILRRSHFRSFRKPKLRATVGDHITEAFCGTCCELFEGSRRWSGHRCCNASLILHEHPRANTCSGCPLLNLPEACPASQSNVLESGNIYCSANIAVSWNIGKV